MLSCIGRILGGIVAQYIGVLASIKVFASPGGTVFWWTQTAIAIAAMLYTPDTHWPERVGHIASSTLTYIPFRFRKFSVPLLLAICACNSLGQFFGYVSMKHFYPVLSPKEVGTLRFLAIFVAFPVIIASIVVSLPGSLAFYFLGTDVELSSVVVNYTLGHISGTMALLYPLLIVPALWKTRPRSPNTLVCGLRFFFGITSMCPFSDYHLFGFASIVGMYALLIGVSAYIDQFQASLVQLACTGSILGFTAAGRGPFVHVMKDGEAEEVLIRIQMGIAVLSALNAFVVILVSQLRDLQKFERISRCQAAELAERQTLDLYRIGQDMKNNATLIQAICEVGETDGDNRILETLKSVNILGNVLVSDMVDTVSGKRVHRVVPKEVVDITELLNVYSMVGTGLLMLEGKDKDITAGVRIDDDSENFGAYTNRERLHQIMCNLLSNAAKYTQSGEIVLGVGFSSESTVKIRVTDSGIGLSEADVCKIFDPFFRSGRASQINSGTGLGLFNVRNIRDAIDAKIEVSSPGEGKGSTFTLSLPRKRHSIVSGERQILTRFSFRVLAMDDSVLILRLLTKYMTSLGCEVVNACSAEESRALLGQPNQEKFDVVITDSHMGDEMGKDFINSLRRGAIRGLPSDLPFILCSGDSHEFDDPRTISITKPFSLADIADALNNFAPSNVILDHA
ncbi:unnamed protein product [Ectocarpus sp. 4 AP-2014]